MENEKKPTAEELLNQPKKKFDWNNLGMAALVIILIIVTISLTSQLQAFNKYDIHCYSGKNVTTGEFMSETLPEDNYTACVSPVINTATQNLSYSCYNLSVNRNELCMMMLSK